MTANNVLNLEPPTDDLVIPLKIRKLYDIVHTHAEVGRRIGCSGSTVSKALQGDAVARCYELAAHAVLALEFPEPAMPTALVRAPADTMRLIKPAIIAAGGSYTEV